MERPVIIIEHLEDGFSPWLFLEYRHSSMIAGREYLWITNLPRRYHGLMSRYGRVFEESVIDLIGGGSIAPDKVIVLDPSAREMLKRYEIDGSYIVIGGILGDHPPKHRTYKLLTSRLRGVKARSIGEGQYSIDGTVYFVIHYWRFGLENYRFIDGLRIKTENGYIKLPFRYPLVDGKPLLAPGLEYYLKYGRLPEEIAREIGLSK